MFCCEGRADTLCRLLLGSAETTAAGVRPMKHKKVVVAGATGLVGNAALQHFGASGLVKSSRCRAEGRANSMVLVMFRPI